MSLKHAKFHIACLGWTPDCKNYSAIRYITDIDESQAHGIMPKFEIDIEAKTWSAKEAESVKKQLDDIGWSAIIVKEPANENHVYRYRN